MSQQHLPTGPPVALSAPERARNNLLLAIGAACVGLLALTVGIITISSASPNPGQRCSDETGITVCDNSDPGFAAKAIGTLLIILAIAAFAIAVWRFVVARGTVSDRPSTLVPVLAPAGWYADPSDPELLRYWTGSQWSEGTHAPASDSPANR